MPIDYIDICPTIQRQVDFQKVKEAGFRGVLIKSSQYSSTTIYQFDGFAASARSAGLAVGAYHYAYCGADPEKQADFFYQAANAVGSRPGDMPPVLDVEFGLGPPYDKASKPLGASVIVQWTEAFLRRATQLWYPNAGLEAEAGRHVRKPKVYLFPNFAKGLQPHLGASELTSYELHYACYYGDPKKPKTLAWYPGEAGTPSLPWNVPVGMRCTDWQYSGNHGRKVPGIPNDTDRNLFLGSEEDWQRNLGIINRPAHSTTYGVKDDTATRP